MSAAVDQEDIEERWENAVFEVCDARERYPKLCAEEFDKYLQCRNNIAMEPVVLQPSPEIFDIPQTVCAEEEDASERGNGIRRNRGKGDLRSQSIMDKLRELKVALKQLEDNKNFEIQHRSK